MEDAWRMGASQYLTISSGCLTLNHAIEDLEAIYHARPKAAAVNIDGAPARDSI